MEFARGYRAAGVRNIGDDIPSDTTGFDQASGKSTRPFSHRQIF
jgi:hypothetical protein